MKYNVLFRCVGPVWCYGKICIYKVLWIVPLETKLCCTREFNFPIYYQN